MQGGAQSKRARDSRLGEAHGNPDAEQAELP
jgi:hypothetical protein